MQFGDDIRIAWCSRCRREVTRRGLYDRDGVLIDEKDPICSRCMFVAELLEPAELHRRNLAEQAVAFADVLASRAEKKQRETVAPLDPNALLDVDGAAARLKLSASTVYKRASAGTLTAVKDGGRLLFRPADLDAYVEANRRSPERVAKLATPKRRG